jgi:hypothetical protein
MLEKIKKGETYFSNYIDKEQQIKLVSKIESINFLNSLILITKR